LKRPRFFIVGIALAGAAIASLTSSAVVAAKPSTLCSPIWDYPLDSWRIHPDALVVDGSDVTLKWHIDDVYLPGAPDASANLNASIDIQIDDGPILTEDIFQAARQLTSRRLDISNLKGGRHKVILNLSGPAGYFTSCFTVPSQSSITHWYAPDEAIPIRQRSPS
jgi:hypothetical protein